MVSVVSLLSISVCMIRLLREMAMLTLTPEIKRRITSAQSTRLVWSKACNSGVRKVVEGHANTVGAPKEFIFVPLLTVVASFMGVNASMRINAEWCEPANSVYILLWAHPVTVVLLLQTASQP